MESVVRLIRDPVAAKGVRDQFGRRMDYLRISLTDRCNFRCLYCMPEMGMKFQPRDEMLTDDELIRDRRALRATRLHQAAAHRRRADDPAAPRRSRARDEGVPRHPRTLDDHQRPPAWPDGGRPQGGRSRPHQHQHRHARSGEVPVHDPGRPPRPRLAGDRSGRSRWPDAGQAQFGRAARAERCRCRRNGAADDRPSVARAVPRNHADGGRRPRLRRRAGDFGRNPGAPRSRVRAARGDPDAIPPIRRAPGGFRARRAPSGSSRRSPPRSANPATGFASPRTATCASASCGPTRSTCAT